MQLVAKSDASYAENVNGKSNTSMWTKKVIQQVILGSRVITAVGLSGSALSNRLWRYHLRKRIYCDFYDRMCSGIILRELFQLELITSTLRDYWSKGPAHSRRRNISRSASSGLHLIYVPFEELVADILTKATTGVKFNYLGGKLLGLMEGEE